MDTFTLYDTKKRQLLDDEITILQFVDFYLSDIEDLDSELSHKNKQRYILNLTHMGRSQEFNFRNFYFVKN